MTSPNPPRQSRRERRSATRKDRRQKREQETRLHQQAQELLRQHRTAPTYWLGQRCDARRVKVLLAGSVEAVGRSGLVVDAVRVDLGEGLLYLDDTNGAGWLKVTAGYGCAKIPHRELDLERLVELEERPAASVLLEEPA